MEVVGYDPETGEPITAGDVMGDVMGAARRRRTIALPPKAGWRHGQLATGVQQPDEGLVPLPLTANAGSPLGTFTSTISTMIFSGQLQKPFRAERLLVSTVRTGATSVGRLLGQIFVGTDMQQAEIFGFDIELVGQAGSFGTRLTCKPADPGVLLRIQVTLSTALTAPDTIFASMMFLGRIIH